MGRFDLLTELDEKKPLVEKSPKPESKQTAKPTSPLVHKPTNPQVGKPTNGFVDKPTSGLLPQPIHEKPQKYTTHLHPDKVKLIKLFAVQHDIKDYEVVDNALTEYFERNK